MLVKNKAFVSTALAEEKKKDVVTHQWIENQVEQTSVLALPVWTKTERASENKPSHDCTR